MMWNNDIFGFSCHLNEEELCHFCLFLELIRRRLMTLMFVPSIDMMRTNVYFVCNFDLYDGNK